MKSKRRKGKQLNETSIYRDSAHDRNHSFSIIRAMGDEVGR